MQNKGLAWTLKHLNLLKEWKRLILNFQSIPASKKIGKFCCLLNFSFIFFGFSVFSASVSSCLIGYPLPCVNSGVISNVKTFSICKAVYFNLNQCRQKFGFRPLIENYWPYTRKNLYSNFYVWLSFRFRLRFKLFLS